MALTNCYVALAEVKTRLGHSTERDDVALELEITRACRAIDVHCGQQFYQDSGATAKTYMPGSSSYVRTDPISTTTALAVKTDSGDDAAFATTWASTDYELEPFGGFNGGLTAATYSTIWAVGDYLFPTSNRRKASVQVTARWGWATTPDMVKEAAAVLSVEFWKRKDTPFGLASQSIEFGAVRIGRDVMAQVGSLLTRYVRVDRTVGIA